MSDDPDLVVFIGQFPPPVTGFSLVTARLCETLRATNTLVAVDIGGTRGRGRLVYHASRLVRLGAAIMRVLAARAFASRPVVYVACDGLGIVYAFALVAATRCLGLRIYVHHHCYDYIDHARPLMRALLAAGGLNATHIVLSAEMGQALAGRYGRRIEAVVLSNAAFVPPPARPAEHPPATGRPFTIGLLANLDASKGLFIFLDLLEAATGQGLDVQGVLAGPLVDEADRPAVEAAQARLGERLQWLGRVDGARKDAFFAGLDLFVFPTTYAAEAQPMVVFEALAAGVPVIAYERGTIRSQIGDAGVVVTRDADFVDAVLPEIHQLQADRARLRRFRGAAYMLFADERADALARASNVFDSSRKVLIECRQA